MRLLDLYSGAGGAAVGYSRAGFTEIVGVDIVNQPRYPFQFVQGDALEYLEAHGREFDAIHASPPCQAYTAMRFIHADKEHPDLVALTRAALRITGKHYVIENVPGAPLIAPTILNGPMFGLRVSRTRLFETSFPLPFFLLSKGARPVKVGRPIQEGDVFTPVGHMSGVGYVKREMGCDWMVQSELSQAIPPAYTEYIGARLLEAIGRGEPMPPAQAAPVDHASLVAASQRYRARRRRQASGPAVF